MVALGYNRAGTVPVLDMTFHTPVIILLGVLEVNLAIMAASIPIFWPLVAALTGNKIFVVNEVEIHVEQASRSSFGSDRGINLSEQNKWKDGKDGFVGRSLSITTKAYTHNKPPPAHHRHKPSNTSSMGRPRASQESTRNLCKTKSDELSSNGSLTRNDADDWFAEVDKDLAGVGVTTEIEHNDVRRI